jgi:hypothetical protein
MKKQSPRIEIGDPFAKLLDELLVPANTGNLSDDWNRTDLTRYAIAELYKRTGRPLPKNCLSLLPRFYMDLDV